MANFSGKKLPLFRTSDNIYVLDTRLVQGRYIPKYDLIHAASSYLKQNCHFKLFIATWKRNIYINYLLEYYDLLK